MDSNTYSNPPPTGRPAGSPGDQPNGLAALTAALDQLEGQDLDTLPDAVRAERVPALRRLADRLEGQWLKELAGVDAHGAAGADQDQPARSTASWLRNRLRMGAGTAHSAVRTARALFRGPLPQTAQALVKGELSVAHAKAMVDGTHHLPAHVTAEAEPVLLEAARRLDPPRLRQAVGFLLEVADPEGADAARQRRHGRRGCGCRRPWTTWWRWMGCWSPRLATRSWPLWNPWPARTTPTTPAVVASAPPTP